MSDSGSAGSRPLVCGIAGGSASGKTTVMRKVLAAFPPHHVALLDQDSYYVDLSDIGIEERRLFNFDHPDAFDTELLAGHIEALRNGQAVAKPIYSYQDYNRTDRTLTVAPAPLIIVEGLLVLWSARLRRLMDIKIFVDTPDDIRLIRRIERDVQERGRDLRSVISQYLRTVRPMHSSFCEPSKQFADIIVPQGGHNEVAINMVTESLASRLPQ